MVLAERVQCIRCFPGYYRYDPVDQWEKCWSCGDIQYHLWLVVQEAPDLAPTLFALPEEEPEPEPPAPPVLKKKNGRPLRGQPSPWDERTKRLTEEQLEVFFGYGEYRVRRE